MPPTFPVIWPKVHELICDSIYILAHNASFDRNVLNACCEKFGFRTSTQPFLCTLKGSRRCLDIPSKNLSCVCEYLGIDLKHHHAGSDAQACALIYIHLKSFGILDKDMLLNKKL